MCSGALRVLQEVSSEFGVVAVFVDDLILINSNTNDMNKTKKSLQSQFKMRDLGVVKNLLVYASGVTSQVST